MIDHFRQAFLEEAGELLLELETGLLELEEHPGDREIVDRVFRALHTLKGSSSMFAFDAIATFTHEVETVFELVRSGSLPVTGELIRFTLQARDWIKEQLFPPNSPKETSPTDTDGLVAAFRGMITGEFRADTTEQPGTRTATTYFIHFRPERELYHRGLTPEHILGELTELGECRIRMLTDVVPPLDELDPELCYLGWEVELTTTAEFAAVQEAFMYLGDGSSVEILPCPVYTGDGPAEIFVPPVVEPEGGADAGETVVAGNDQQRPKAISSIRVAAEKLDQLINLVGELVTAQARLSQISLARSDADLLNLAEEIERLTGGLRDTALNIRMIPIGGTFSRFRRLVHDLSLELGKEVELVTEGAETELDKTVIEKLADPLVHLIRNCVDHGIEEPAGRRAAGKPARGTIHLSAVHSGDSVLITIKDDGGGIDREAVLARGIEKGLVPSGVELSERELFNLVFTPGFSTSASLTSISGRGVGMDVVKRSVESLRGAITINSIPGCGTTVTVRIPLTLAIIESLLVRIGEDCFVLPLSQVEECIELTCDDVARAHGRHLVQVREHLIPYIPLRARFGIDGSPPVIQQVVIVDLAEGRRVGLVVDHVVGGHQTVIKSIGKMFRETTGISGATILGDGSVALILDIQQLVAEEELLEQSSAGPETATPHCEQKQRRDWYE